MKHPGTLFRSFPLRGRAVLSIRDHELFMPAGGEISNEYDQQKRLPRFRTLDTERQSRDRWNPATGREVGPQQPTDRLQLATSGKRSAIIAVPVWLAAAGTSHERGFRRIRKPCRIAAEQTGRGYSQHPQRPAFSFQRRSAAGSGTAPFTDSTRAGTELLSTVADAFIRLTFVAVGGPGPNTNTNTNRKTFCSTERSSGRQACHGTEKYCTDAA